MNFLQDLLQIKLSLIKAEMWVVAANPHQLFQLAFVPLCLGWHNVCVSINVKHSQFV